MKMHHEEIKEGLELIYNGMFELEGEVITRFQDYCLNDE